MKFKMLCILSAVIGSVVAMTAIDKKESACVNKITIQCQERGENEISECTGQQGREEAYRAIPVRPLGDTAGVAKRRTSPQTRKTVPDSNKGKEKDTRDLKKNKPNRDTRKKDAQGKNVVTMKERNLKISNYSIHLPGATFTMPDDGKFTGIIWIHLKMSDKDKKYKGEYVWDVSKTKITDEVKDITDFYVKAVEYTAGKRKEEKVTDIQERITYRITNQTGPAVEVNINRVSYVLAGAWPNPPYKEDRQSFIRSCFFRDKSRIKSIAETLAKAGNIENTFSDAESERKRTGKQGMEYGTFSTFVQTYGNNQDTSTLLILLDCPMSTNKEGKVECRFADRYMTADNFAETLNSIQNENLKLVLFIVGDHSEGMITDKIKKPYFAICNCLHKEKSFKSQGEGDAGVYHASRKISDCIRQYKSEKVMYSHIFTALNNNIQYNSAKLTKKEQENFPQQINEHQQAVSHLCIKKSKDFPVGAFFLR